MRDKNQRGLFDEELRLEKLTKSGDPLVEMNKLIDWEMFRPLLTKVLKKEPKSPGGRPPYDYVMMFKILRTNGISNK